VRIPDLPIEYYDAKVLTFIGNRIGKTVKVDKKYFVAGTSEGLTKAWKWNE
jgi:hypothetical protein